MNLYLLRNLTKFIFPQDDINENYRLVGLNYHNYCQLIQDLLKPFVESAAENFFENYFVLDVRNIVSLLFHFYTGFLKSF